jgi:hypothetical protein
MFKPIRDSRILVAGATGIAAVVLIVSLIMIPTVIGVADSGDFGRVFGVTGLTQIDPKAPFDVLYFRYAHQDFSYGGYLSGGYVSTHVILVAIAGLIGRVFNTDVFDIRVLGSSYGILFVWVLVLLVKNSPKLNKEKYTFIISLLFAVTLLFVFCDIGYLAYFQSFFGEPYAFIGLLFVVASAIALSAAPQPSARLLALFVVAALAVATSKIQNAPLGFALALLAWRMAGLRPDTRWRKQAFGGAALLVIVSALMFIVAPDRLKNTNLYQSIFFGVLKDSPNVERDLRELGIPQKYSVLAGTNYFQQDTAIPQRDPVLRREVLERLSPKDIAFYYLRHPSRFIQKLERAADNAMFIRPLYLGNYDPSAGKAPGAISHRYSEWSQWKVKHMPRYLGFYVGWYVAYLTAITLWWLRTNSRRVRLLLETLAIVALAGLFACMVPLIGDGEADLGKHLFMFNVCFDMMGVSVVMGAAYGLAKVVESRAAR